MQAVRALRPIFKSNGIELPEEVRVSVGWPGGRGKKDGVIGQCWSSKASEDGVHQIFISPVLKDSDRVLATLVHELVHAVDDCNGHRAAFGRMARAMGLEGPLTATVAGDELKATLDKIIGKLGDYPHAALRGAVATSQPKQTTRMLKVECPDDGYTVRTTRKWLDAMGTPVCPCGLQMEVA